MKSDNEAAIGLYRVDGTAKPELHAVKEYARFIAAQRHLMQGKKDEEVVLVIPHSNMFSVRNSAGDATRRSVRAMYYDCNVPLRAISEYRLPLLNDAPQLMVLPSARVLTDEAWDRLLAFVDRGSVLLMTGAIDANEHWLDRPRLKQLGIEAVTRPITQEETLVIGRKEHRLSYRGEKIQRIEKSVIASDKAAAVMTLQRGKGKIVWSPLPVEISDTSETTSALYRFALKEAGIKAVCEIERDFSSVLIAPTVYDEAVLYTLVSECDRDTDIKLTHRETNTPVNITVRAQRSALVFVDRKTGKVLAQRT
jgi:phosphopantetheinyl transferase (holo-ACP synthase)